MNPVVAVQLLSEEVAVVGTGNNVVVGGEDQPEMLAEVGAAAVACSGAAAADTHPFCVLN